MAIFLLTAHEVKSIFYLSSLLSPPLPNKSINKTSNLLECWRIAFQEKLIKQKIETFPFIQQSSEPLRAQFLREGMKLPIYCILHGYRAVKAIRTDEGGLTVLEYYPADDKFRMDIGLLHRVLSDDLDVEYVTKEDFDAFVERERAKYQADPELRRKEKITAMRNARNMILLAVREVDPERAKDLKAEFPEDQKESNLTEERELQIEEGLTKKLIEAVANMGDRLVKISVVTARRTTGLLE